MINGISGSEILMDQKCEEMLFLTCLNAQTQISSLLYLLRFPIKETNWILIVHKSKLDVLTGVFEDKGIDFNHVR